MRKQHPEIVALDTRAGFGSAIEALGQERQGSVSPEITAAILADESVCRASADRPLRVR
jgi:hypothetical protein